MGRAVDICTAEGWRTEQCRSGGTPGPGLVINFVVLPGSWGIQHLYLQVFIHVFEEEKITKENCQWILIFLCVFKVRVAGLGIGVALTLTESGRTVLTSHCIHIPGGVWGVAFGILLDQSECSMVRQQAALLLVNMTSQPMPCGSVEMEENVWQGPVVADTESKVSVAPPLNLHEKMIHSVRYKKS